MSSIHTNQGGFFLIIPAYIADDPDLCPGAKLFFGRLTQLTSQQGYCWASNDYLAKLCNIKPRMIQYWISSLIKKNYIYIEMTAKDRRIFTTLSSFKKSSTHEKNNGGDAKNCMGECKKLHTNKETEQEKRKESVVSGGCTPLDSNEISPSRISFQSGNGNISLTDSQIFEKAIREKSNFTTEEIVYAFQALKECKSVVWDWWQFVVGTINNLRNKKKSINITDSKKGIYECKTKKIKDSNCKKDSSKASPAAQQDSSALHSPISILDMIQQLELQNGAKIPRTS